MNYLRGSVIVLLIATLLFSDKIPEKKELKTTSQDIFPKYYIVEKSGEKQIGGMMIDMIEEMNKQMDHIKIIHDNQFSPWKRILHNLESGEIDLFFGIAKTPEREKKIIYIEPPVINVSTVFCVRRDDDIHIQNFEDISLLYGDKTILAQFGSSNAVWAKKMSAPFGLKIDEGGKTTEINLEKLILKYGRVYIHHDLAIRSMIHKNHLQNKVKVLPVKLKTFGHYIAFSKYVPQETITEVQEALITMEKTGKLTEIQNYYLGF